jgi:hypothetical protein
MICPWPEGIRGPCYERGSQWLDSTHGCQFIPTPTEFGAGPPKAGCECSTHSVGAIWPLKHIEMCSALVMRRQLVQIQPSAPDMPFKL